MLLYIFRSDNPHPGPDTGKPAKKLRASEYLFLHLPLFTFNTAYLFNWNDRLICRDYGMLIFIYLFYNTRARNIGSAGFFCIGNKISYRYLLFYTDIISDYINFLFS